MLLKNSSVSEREEKMKKGLEEEESRKNINDSKFRAVAQRMDYSGFHQMVLGANLKPTKAGEVYSISDGKKSIFNTACKKSGSQQPKKSDSDTLIVKWRRSNNQEKLELLEDLEEFKNELRKLSDFGMLADIVGICHESDNQDFVQRIFEMLTEVPDFKGSRKMLTRSEKQKLDEILGRIGSDTITDYLTK